MYSRQRKSQATGAHFEAVFAFHAKRCNVLALRQGTSVKYLAGGRAVAQRSGLDFVLIADGGAVAFADCKAWSADFFTYGQLTEHQRILAHSIERKGGTAGFVCWFKPSDRVAFFAATLLEANGPRSRFTLSDGLPMGCGRLVTFDGLFSQP